MSLEKERDTEKKEKNTVLEDSSFREDDFTPLDRKSVENKESKTEDLITEELSDIEKDVLEIAEEILKLKRYDSDFEIESQSQIQKYPIIEKLYATCIAKLSFNKGYSKEDIFLSIRSLEDKNWIVTNERRTKLEILTNEKLVEILDFIRNNPGIHGRDERIEDEIGITRTPFLKHIMTLENFDLIRSKKIGKSLHYFIKDVPEDFDDYKVIFINPMIPSIIEEFFKDEAVPISQIANKLDVYPGTISYHLKKMKKLNLIKSSENKNGEKIHLVNIQLLKKYNQIFKKPNFSDLLRGL
ncbi:MAG: winged helix-turn-helix transcriptional regulator [Candidatus Lokiarchaeota archaeon]|nr:winged helix-turn-helix transcriptional regulator [Candidatus Lokiarchaeota archaeon]MBD3199240.1 winged helix-turn-helix transcriptional regulator [Candidatus Lokiarchaeota archaeon]